jgi:putative acetyltransferase
VPTPKICRATVDDATGIGRVHVDAVRQLCKLHYTSPEIEAWVGKLRPGSHAEDIEAFEFFIATDDAKTVLGFSVLDPSKGEVMAVYVHPTTTRRGIATALLRQIEGVARDRGLAMLHLDASLNSVEFYLSAGYVPQDQRQHRLRSGVVIRSISMSKVLGSEDEPVRGQPAMPIYVVPYDDSWPSRFDRERTALVAALGEHAIAIEHVGSTAIPGIMAKPIIQAARYETLKRDLAARFPHDREAYTEGKAQFVGSVTERAKRSTRT